MFGERFTLVCINENVRVSYVARTASASPKLVLGRLEPVQNVVDAVALNIVGLLIGVPIKLYSETYKTKSEMLHDMRYYSLYPGILAVVCCWAITMMSYGSGVASNRLVARIRVVAFGAVFRHEVGWFDFTENSSGALVSRLTSDPAVLHSMTWQKTLVMTVMVPLQLHDGGLAGHQPP
ncbi:hypothetical protein JG688_00010619 [Phytophthora aleatoria]|uniref:ABC transmembrane type-1 domain-containing protein n=1 Tax=Phytophthora aleatoria TaxID=2496075 RepID=A0A8J5IVW1_9STRA|nr:hypothetical protein JG688_00010619 [Phytophthora aleatoria]